VSVVESSSLLIIISKKNTMAKEEVVKTPSVKEQEILLGDLGLTRYHKKIEKILRKFMDMKEEYYSVISLWIIGTYLHKQFNSYPYLFFNAMKGSGKTRILNIVANLSKDGKLNLSVTKAGVFRSKGTYCLDEFEGIGRKGNEDLKELINGAYKKGGTITRYDDVKKTPEGEEFNIYRPVAMANIWGMENVLADRCISLILEKSSKKKITRLIENFDNDMEFEEIKGGLMRLTENISDELNYFGGVIDEWNVIARLDVLDVSTLKTSKYQDLLRKIHGINIEGRDLELFFPLFIIADICGKKVFEDVIKFSKKIIDQRRAQDREDNIDVQIYDFVSQYPTKEFVFVSEFTREFKEFVGITDEWLNSRFLGRGLRRLNLVLGEKHTNKRSIRLDLKKAQEKIKLFVEPEEIKSEFEGVFEDGQK